jgi:polyribonucleotide nucleotidyltransferase
MSKKTFDLQLGGNTLTIEIPHWAEKANGEALVRYGDTTVLATAVMGNERGDQGFFPLTVEYEERYYAAGKIRGSRFIRREGRPSDEAIGNARLIDRAIRPRFPKEFKREVQVVVTCLSWDGQNDPDVLGLLAASVALSISDIPWQGPIAALRVGRINGEWVINTPYELREKSDIDAVFAGGLPPNDSKLPQEFLINMIEGDFQEATEEAIVAAFDFVREPLQKLLDFQQDILLQEGKGKLTVEPELRDVALEHELREFLGSRLEDALLIADEGGSGKMERVNALRDELVYFVDGKYPGESKSIYARAFFERELDRILKESILKNERRPDGRKLDEIREISVEAGVLPRTHGSGLFRRGQTRALSILTLGAPADQQLLEGMEIVGKKRFMHHYNFPPYCSGEIKPMRGPGRREIGHGMLAERALRPLIPEFETFPYTIRVVTEILSSNGSTSMASVSAASLALMDAGVPVRAPAAGISMGIVMDESGNYKLLTDIQGPEDHHGGMDFKVAGTRKGVTAIQMDVKIVGITKKILQEALVRAKKAREEILDKMEKVLPGPRPHLSPYAPRILTLQIHPEKIRDVIGPGGKVINEIIDETGVQIDIEQSGRVFITSEREDSAKKAADWIRNITREARVGEVFQGKVKRIVDFGAFVEIWPGQDGLVHISQLAPWRVGKVTDVVKVGDVVPVKVISIDEQGRINLSMKDVKGSVRSDQ